MRLALGFISHTRGGGPYVGYVAPVVAIIFPTRVGMDLLPEPGPAMMRRGPSVVCMASRCSALAQVGKGSSSAVSCWVVLRIWGNRRYCNLRYVLFGSTWRAARVTWFLGLCPGT